MAQGRCHEQRSAGPAEVERLSHYPEDQADVQQDQRGPDEPLPPTLAVAARAGKQPEGHAKNELGQPTDHDDVKVGGPQEAPCGVDRHGNARTQAEEQVTEGESNEESGLDGHGDWMDTASVVEGKVPRPMILS